MDGFERWHMNKNIEQFFEYFKNSHADIYTLSNEDASTHALAIRKFFEVYIEENNKNLLEGSLEFIDSCTADRIFEFTNLLAHKIERAQSKEHFENSRLIDRDALSKLMDIGRESKKASEKMIYNSEYIQEIADRYSR